MKIIILYDSNDGVPEALQFLLEQAGYEVIIADNVPHFKQLVTQLFHLKSFFLIVSDINLSDWGEGEDGGILVIQSLKEHGIVVPTIFFTKYPNREESTIYQRAKKLSPFFLGEKEANNLEKVCDVIEHAIVHYNNLIPRQINKEQDIFLYSGGQGESTYFIRIKDICYWVGDGVYSHLYTCSGQHIHRALTVAAIWTQIQDVSPYLKRLGVGPIVNLKNIIRYHENYLYFEGKNVPPLQIPHAQWVSLRQGLIEIKNI
ncbi:MAG: hypothetical protein ACRCZI_06190 [Cetobacterium sp.]